MTPAFSARRRADEFEALVSSSDPTPLTERDARDFAALLAVVEDLRSVPEVAARPGFVTDLREQLMTAAETALVPAKEAGRPSVAPPPRSRGRQRRLSVLLGGAALVGATATVAVAAQNALPGEALYPVKRGIESAQLLVVSGPDKGRAQLANAADRLTELEALSTRDDDARTATLAADTLHSFTEQAEEGGELLLQAYAETDDRSYVEDVHDFNVTSMSRLSDLEETLPADSREALAGAVTALVDLDRQASAACAVCSGGLGSMPAPRELVIDLGDVGTAPQPRGVPGTGQEVAGIEVPELEVPPLPTSDPLPQASPLPTTPTSPAAPKKPGEVLTGTTEKVEETLKGTGEPLEGTEETVDEVTSGVTGSVDGITDGAIDGVDQWVDYLSTTPEKLLPGPTLPDGALP